MFVEVSFPIVVLVEVSLPIVVLVEVSFPIVVLVEVSFPIVVLVEVSFPIVVFVEVSLPIVVLVEVSFPIVVFEDVSLPIVVLVEVSLPIVVLVEVSFPIVVFVEVSLPIVVLVDGVEGGVLGRVGGGVVELFTVMLVVVSLFIDAVLGDGFSVVGAPRFCSGANQCLTRPCLGSFSLQRHTMLFPNPHVGTTCLQSTSAEPPRIYGRNGYISK